MPPDATPPAPRRRVLDVVFDPKTTGRQAEYTYLARPEDQVGHAVLAPLGKRTVLGYVAAVRPQNGDDPAELREVSETLPDLSIPEATVRLARETARANLTDLPAAMALLFPPGIKDRLQRVYGVGPGDGQPISAIQQEMVRVVSEANGAFSLAAHTEFTRPMLRQWKDLEARGFVTARTRVKPFRGAGGGIELFRLPSESERVEAFIRQEASRRPAQVLTLVQLQNSATEELSLAEIRAMAGVTESTVKALVQAGMIVPVGREVKQGERPVPVPHPAQSIAISAIADAVQRREHRAFLLFGVTGSGKTEVYLQAIKAALAAGRTAVYLVPEIALASLAIGQLRDRFGAPVVILHSEMTPVERLRRWQEIRNGQAAVVLGPRSALFAPLGNIGVVVMDEEHDGAYKQESAPRYHARSVARTLARLHQCPVVYGSATPSLEIFEAAEATEAGLPPAEPVSLLRMPARAATAQLPEVRIVDLAELYRNRAPALLTPLLLEAMSETLDAGDQTILFINRRAYAPFILCRSCGERIGCPRCSVSLAFHRSLGRLKCHQCNFEQSVPTNCPKCGSDKLAPFGVGTEKVEEAVREAFPTARVARLDRDVTERAGALEATLAGFRAGEIDVLVGTQMVAKGLDFPRVTLVGGIAADVSLNIPDFRASERTFQLLTQVAGRAGRGQRPGRVIIQTFNPEHPAVVMAARHDTLGFLEFERQERRLANYPPFCTLVNVVVAGRDRKQVAQATQRIAAGLKHFQEFVLGPADCALERLNDQWRRHLLVKLPLDRDPATLGPLIPRDFPGCSVTIDVNPTNLM